MSDATSSPATESEAWGVPPATLLVGAGPRAVEERLLAELERVLPDGGGVSAARADPVRVVVPSGGLRTHLLAVLTRRRPAWVGLEVSTLRAVALAVVERAGDSPPRGAALLPVLARRAALREPELARPLEPLEGGFAPLVGTVRDLLDAGLTPALAAGVLELLASEEAALAGGERARAAAVVRVATDAAERLEALGRSAGAALYRRAAELVAAFPASVPPARRLFVHGFADATGAVAELLGALAHRIPSTILFDLPRTAAGPPRELLTEPFGAALRERLAAGRRPVAFDQAAEPELDAFAALGESAEAGEVARRVRAALEAGARPEAIGVVARDLGRHLVPLRRALDGAAIPYSVEGAALAPAELRAALTLVRLLDERSGTRPDTVVELLGPGLALNAPAAELRLAVRVLGVSNLAELARFDLASHLGGADSLPLPVRGLAEEESGSEASYRPRSRRLERAALARFLADARRLARAVAALPERAPARAHLGALGSLARSALPAEGAAAPWLAGALARLAADLPAELELGRDEVAELVARAAQAMEAVRPGGRGGGVQLLSVVAARARTFDRLYVLGVNRGAFPRVAEEDPLLSDAARRALRALLPDLPVKRESLFEERFLFDQLASAAPQVTFSFLSRADDATPRLISPLLDRLSWRDETTRALRDRWQRSLPPSAPADWAGALSPRRRALRAGLAGDRGGWQLWLAAALAEARGRDGVHEADLALAAAHAEALAELDPDPSTPDGQRIWRRLGPFFGRVGAGAIRRDRLFVTLVEQVHACGWKTLLERGLGLEPLADPLLDLPAPLDPRLVGTGAHRLLERLLAPGRGERSMPLGELIAEEAERRPFPTADAIASGAHAIASALLVEEGLALWGFERLLAAAIGRAALAAGGDWDQGPVAIVGVEVEGSADLVPRGAPLTLGFRADRVDRAGERIVLTDYKSWTPAGLKARVGGARWLAALRRGLHLQPAAYVAALGGAPVHGRFLALGEEDETGPASRAATLDEHATAELAALAAAARRAAAALASGRLPPRMVDPTGYEAGPSCRYCAVAEACLQGDSAARRRLRDWTEDRRARGPESASPADVAEAELVLAHDPVAEST